MVKKSKRCRKKPFSTRKEALDEAHKYEEQIVFSRKMNFYYCKEHEAYHIGHRARSTSKNLDHFMKTKGKDYGTEK